MKSKAIKLPDNLPVPTKWEKFKWALAENSIVHCICAFINKSLLYCITLPLIPVFCLKHYFIICWQAFKEILAFNRFLRYDEFLNFHKDIYIVNYPQTEWLLKKCSFYHQDKPELLEEIVIAAFEDWYYNEKSDMTIYSKKDEYLFQKIIKNIKAMKKLQDNYKTFDKGLKLQERIANQIWKIRSILWE